MKFEELCELVQRSNLEIVTNSKLVQGKEIFVALPSAISSHLEKKQLPLEYLLEAVQKNTSYVVLEQELYNQAMQDKNLQNTSYVVVDDARIALGILAKHKYQNINLTFPIVAITGTNGKTTSAYLLEHLYKSLGKNVAVFGTVSYHWNNYFEEAPLTTPDCLTLHKMLAKAREAKVDAVIMEVSSHALDQNRLAGIEIAAALFTNLTQDHLDYHENMENYFQAKLRLFTEQELKNKAISVCASDLFGKRILTVCQNSKGFMLANCATEINSENILSGVIKNISPNGLEIEHQFQGQTWTLNSSLVGEHNALNILGVESLALELGFKIEDLKCLESFSGVPGRLERINSGHEQNEISYFVDYAHTPDALVQAQKALRQAGFNRIITVFGCGGDRDRAKRPLMGQAVAEDSDIVIVTSDNPRTEDPEQIIADILPGLSKAKEVHSFVNRRDALYFVVSIARNGDAVLVAGKGHETYQIIGKEKHYFSDQAILQELIK